MVRALRAVPLAVMPEGVEHFMNNCMIEDVVMSRSP